MDTIPSETVDLDGLLVNRRTPFARRSNRKGSEGLLQA